MKYCPNCGSKVNNSNFCPTCGVNQYGESLQLRKCPYCRNYIDKKASVCPNCNRQVKTPAIAWMVLIIIVLLIILSCTRTHINDKGETEYGSIIYPYPDSMETLITLNEFNMLQFGMTEEEVWNIIGGKCTRIETINTDSATDVLYGCNGSSSTYQMTSATLTFRDGKLKFIANFGLE